MNRAQGASSCRTKAQPNRWFWWCRRAAERKGQERNRGMAFSCLSLKTKNSWVMSEYSQGNGWDFRSKFQESSWESVCSTKGWAVNQTLEHSPLLVSKQSRNVGNVTFWGVGSCLLLLCGLLPPWGNCARRSQRRSLVWMGRSGPQRPLCPQGKLCWVVLEPVPHASLSYPCSWSCSVVSII